LYNVFRASGINVDIRGTKKKQVNCPSSKCNKSFEIAVQSEVDVAIVMKVMSIAFHNQLNTLVLLAGDGDFKDMVEFVTQVLYKKVYIIAYRNSISVSLIEKATPGCIIYLDEIW
jgi:uncharacterized LabA/DUF88 family protein